MEPQDYRPQYDSSVKEWLPNDPQSRGEAAVTPTYCLLPSSANIFASLFTAKPKVFMAPPWEQASGSPFAFNKLVPWLEFPGGLRFNAGLLSSYWGMPGVRYTEAMGYAMKDVEGTW